ncbi:MAG: MFS transporter, partial [Sphingomonadales bacterium]
MGILRSSFAEWRVGWTVVFAGCVGTGTGYGMFLMSAGLFIKPMQDELGWSTSTIAIAPMVLVIAALLSPLGGVIIDRFGARRVAITGLSLFVLAYIIMGLVAMSPWTLYLMVALFGMIGPLSGPAVFTKGVAGWFRHSMGTAFGLTMSGVSLVALFSLPLVAYIIDNFGWRAGYLGLAGIVFLLGLPSVLALFRERAQPLAPLARPGAPAEGVPLRQALKDRRFWLYLTAFT